jgi:putative ABC transport system permease protein
MFKTAIQFIRYDKPKSLGALLGVVISVFLVGQQAGIFIFLTDAMKSIVANNDQYIWVVDAKTVNANQLAQLDMRIGRQLLSLPSVEAVYPVVIAAGAAQFEDGTTAGMTVIGSQAPDFVGGPWGIAPADKALMLPEGAILTEYFDQQTYGDVAKGEYFELNGQKVYNAGFTRGVRGFGGAPYVFTTLERARALSNFPTTRASLFLVKWKPEVGMAATLAEINGALPNVRAWDPARLAESTVGEVLSSSGIALSVGTLIIFALLTGFIIIGLTLYSAAIDRIRDYGTLKAIGATNGYVSRLILTQAMLISMVGFVLGRGLVEGFRQGIAQAGTIFAFPPALELGFFVVTMFIALTGCLFAIRRINSLEPAQVFRA